MKRILLATFMLMIASSSSAQILGHQSSDLFEYCQVDASLEKQTYCLGYLIGVHDSMVFTQKVNGTSGYCMKVETGGRSGQFLKDTFINAYNQVPEVRSSTARTGVAIAYYLTFPCGE